MNRKRLDEAIEEIRKYSSLYEELQKAELFIYDYPPVGFDEVRRGIREPQFVVMGINHSTSKDDLE